MHKSADVMCSLAYSQYLNGEYSSAIYTFEKVNNPRCFYLMEIKLNFIKVTSL